MATRKEKNRIRHKRRELRNKFWILFGRAVAVGFPVFVLLSFLTYIPVNKPIDPADTVTVTVQVTDTRFGEIIIPLGRRKAVEFHNLNIRTSHGRFRITGAIEQKSITEYGDYNVLALNKAIQAGDTITIAYRKYCPYLMPGKYVVDLREGDQVYRTLDVHNKKVEGLLLNRGITSVILILILLPITLFAFNVPLIIWEKVIEKRHKQYLAAKKLPKNYGNNATYENRPPLG